MAATFHAVKARCSRPLLSPWLVIVAASFAVPNFAYARAHRVRSGEWLARILRHQVPGPVWGEQGSLRQVMALNPHIHNADLIEPGQWIHLPNAAQRAKSGRAKSVAKRSHRACPPCPRCDVAGATASVTPTGLSAVGDRAAAAEARIEAAAQRRTMVLGPSASAAAMPTEASDPAQRDAPAPQPTVPSTAVAAPERPAAAEVHQMAVIGGPASQRVAHDTAPSDVELSAVGEGMFVFSQLNSQDNTTGGIAKLTSRSGPGLRLQLTGQLKQRWLWQLLGQVRAMAYAAGTDGGQGLDHAALTLLQGQLSLGFSPNPSWRIWLEGGLGQQVFVGARATQRAVLLATAVPQVQLRLSAVLWAAFDWHLDADLMGGRLWSSATAGAGLTYGGGLSLHRRLRQHVHGHGGLHLSQRSQGSILTSQSETLWQLVLGLRWQI